LFVPWGLKLHREFLSRAIGFELMEAGWFYDSHEWAASARDNHAFYRKQIHPQIVRQIDAGRPVLMTFGPSQSNFGYVITGYDKYIDDDKPPVYGRPAADTRGKYGDCTDWPPGVIMLGKRLEPMDRDAADATALRQAVALARDQAGPTEARWRDRRFTGRKAWAAWATVLRKTAQPTEARFHWNVRGNLLWNRAAAVAYLCEVAERRDGRAADELRQAAATYQKVLEQVKRLNFRGLESTHELRRLLADQVERIAATELEAIEHVEQALKAMEQAK
jgi:hypothetical protein